MTMETTPRWAMPMLHAGQAQKELFHNEALALIDMLLHGRAESADDSAPPSSPAAGQCWIVAAGASGAWAGREGELALWTPGGWRFVAPGEGMALWVADRGHAMHHDGTGWHDGALRADGLYHEGVRVVGARETAIDDPVGGAVIDEEARTGIAAILAAMRAHGLINPS